MKKLIVFCSILLTVCFGCSKDSSSTCEDAIVIFVSNSNNPYRLDIDNKFVTNIMGQETFTTKVSAGSKVFKATQISGYVVYPTIKEELVKIECGVSVNWKFP